MVKAVESQGVKFAVSDGGSPSAFSNVGNITGIKGPGGSANVIDITNLDSVAREKLMGVPDEGQITLDINLDPDNTQHQQLRTARANRTRLEGRITLTDSTPAVGQFYFYVLGYAHDIHVDNPIKVSVTLEVDGPVTWN